MRLITRGVAVATAAFGMLVVANATVFTNFVYSGSLSAGISETNIGNSISFTTPNATVGDPVAPLRFGGLTIQYDAYGGSIFGSDVVGINSTSLGAIAGLGQILFTEDIFAIDAQGNELGNGPIGHVSQILDADSPSWSATVLFSSPSQNIRAKKAFTLLAPDSADPEVLDLASLQLVNQHLNPVPEPASMAVLGIGALALLRKRRQR